jgi:hypothetical protein
MEGMIDHNAGGGLSLPISPALCGYVLDAHLVITPSVYGLPAYTQIHQRTADLGALAFLLP